MKTRKVYGYSLLMLLFLISLFKDKLTPDYLNTPEAFFLNPQHKDYLPVFESHYQYPQFWLTAYGYSLLFICIPSAICYLLISRNLASFTAYVLSAICALEYILVYSGNSVAIIHIVPKLNRYFHSPLLTLFLLASFTLYNQYDNKSN